VCADLIVSNIQLFVAIDNYIEAKEWPVNGRCNRLIIFTTCRFLLAGPRLIEIRGRNRKKNHLTGWWNIFN
jgi:hypothetical protein